MNEAIFKNIMKTVFQSMSLEVVSVFCYDEVIGINNELLKVTGNRAESNTVTFKAENLRIFFIHSLYCTHVVGQLHVLEGEIYLNRSPI
jgi:hypothetical protein